MAVAVMSPSITSVNWITRRALYGLSDDVDEKLRKFLVVKILTLRNKLQIARYYSQEFFKKAQVVFSAIS